MSNTIFMWLFVKHCFNVIFFLHLFSYFSILSADHDQYGQKSALTNWSPETCEWQSFVSAPPSCQSSSNSRQYVHRIDSNIWWKCFVTLRMICAGVTLLNIQLLQHLNTRDIKFGPWSAYSPNNEKNFVKSFTTTELQFQAKETLPELLQRYTGPTQSSSKHRQLE